MAPEFLSFRPLRGEEEEGRREDEDDKAAEVGRKERKTFFLRLVGGVEKKGEKV